MPTPPPPVPLLEAQVRAAKIAQFYSLIPTSVRAGGALTLIVAAALARSAPLVWLLVWVAASWVALVVRLRFYQRFVATDPQARDLARWERGATLALGLSGVVWGVGLALLLPVDEPLLQALILIALCGIAAGVAFANTFHPPSLVAYVVPLLVPMMLRLGGMGTALHLGMATGLGVFLLFVLATGRQQARGTELTIRQRFENERLAQALARERDTAQAARAATEEAGRSKARFFAAANHDLRQPLHALSLSASALQPRPEASHEADVINNLHASIAALETLFDAVLDVARLDAASGPAALSATPLHPLLKRLVDTYRPQARERHLQLRLRVPRDAAVVSEPLMFERIVSNLLTNALRYTRRGGVLLAAQRRGDAWRVAVWDTGIGIARDDQERIFEEFSRLDTTDGERGVGLGLASAKRMANLLGTQMQVQSRVGRGSVFWAMLPACALPVSAAPVSSAPMIAALPSAMLHGCRVLLVEDNELAAQSLAALLAPDGARVLVAATLSDARAMLAQAPVDLILADVDLGAGGSGIGLLDRPEPLIFLTGSTDDATQRRLHSVGRPVLVKPVKPVRLRAAIAAAMRTKSHE